MANFDNIIQEINTNLPDNNTQSITAAKMRTTLIDMLDAVDDADTQIVSDIQEQIDNIDVDFSTGQAISTVGIVDNLKSDDGSTSVLSAKQGFELASTREKVIVNGEDNTLVTPARIPVIPGHKYKITLSNPNIGISNITLSSEYSRLILRAYTNRTTSESGTYVTFYNITLNSALDSEYVVNIPEATETTSYEWFGVSSRFNSGESMVYFIDDITTTEELISDVNKNTNDIDDINTILFGESEQIEIDALTNYEQYNGMSISTDDYFLYTTANSPRKCNYINIENGTTLTIKPKLDKPCVFFISNQAIPKGLTYSDSTVQSQFLAECEGYEKRNGHYYMLIPAGSDAVTLTLNANCKYIYWQIYYANTSNDYTPEILNVVKNERSGGIISEITDELNNVGGTALKLTIKDGKCFTGPIHCEKGFYIKLKDDYRFTNAVLINHLTGEIANDDFITKTVASRQNKIYCRYSNMCKVPGYDIVYQIEQVNGNPIESSNGIIEEFAYVEDLYKRKLPTNISSSIYKSFIDKLQSSIGIVWTPSLEAANRIPQAHGDNDGNRFRRGVTYIGVNYSGPTQWGKHIGIEVSMRTFKTAISNPRSVMYTERIDGSGDYAGNPYGFTHNSYAPEAGAYYGYVCTGLSSYLLGLNSVMTSGYWPTTNSWGNSMFDSVMNGTTSNPNTINYNGTTYSYDDEESCKYLAEQLQPMDFIWNRGHCAVISDIYVDEWDKIKYIVVAEAVSSSGTIGSPTSISGAYTPKDLFMRLKYDIEIDRSWEILRKKTDWTIDEAQIPRIGQDTEYSIMNNSMYNPENMGEVDSNITTFAGEGAVFVIGNYADTTNNFKMFLNVHRGGTNGNNYIQLFNENDDELTATPLDEISIIGNGGNVTQSNILSVDASDKEDWIIYNLAEYWRVNHPNTVGKFKARVVKKVNDTIERYSGCTHFEFVKIEVSISQNNFNFVVEGGTPVQYRAESVSGLIDRFPEDISESDYTTVGNTHTGTDLPIPSNWSNSPFIRLFVKTDYGMANMRIAYNG